MLHNLHKLEAKHVSRPFPLVVQFIYNSFCKIQAVGHRSNFGLIPSFLAIGELLHVLHVLCLPCASYKKKKHRALTLCLYIS